MRAGEAKYIGGIIGLLLFIWKGLVPAIIYGGYAGIELIEALGDFQCVVILFMGLGPLIVGSLFIVVGAVAGALLHIVATQASQLW
jgi:hypothetical protein